MQAVLTSSNCCVTLCKLCSTMSSLLCKYTNRLATCQRNHLHVFSGFHYDGITLSEQHVFVDLTLFFFPADVAIATQLVERFSDSGLFLLTLVDCHDLYYLSSDLFIYIWRDFPFLSYSAIRQTYNLIWDHLSEAFYIKNYSFLDVASSVSFGLYMATLSAAVV